MAKRNFAALVTVLVLAFTTQPLRAESLSITIDGCAELARIVYSEVSSAALYGPGKSGPWIVDSERGDISVCSHTARTVSRAFTSAMSSAGYFVSWDNRYGDSGDYCASGFLSQCYPNRNPLDILSFDANKTVVHQSWAAVSQSVLQHMYNRFSSDEIKFRDNDLKLRLGLALRTVDSTKDF